MKSGTTFNWSPQFSLRHLFILIAFVAILLLAWRVGTRPYRQQAAVASLIEELGGSYKTTPSPTWWRHLAGQELCQDVTSVELVDCDELDLVVPTLARLPRLRRLIIGGRAFAVSHLRQLARLPTLQILVLDSTHITESDIGVTMKPRRDVVVRRSQRGAIAVLRSLGVDLGVSASEEQLGGWGDLHGEHFVDVDTVDVGVTWPLSARFKKREGELTSVVFAYLSRLPTVEHLAVRCPQVTDESFKSIAHLKRLRTLKIIDATKVTAGAFDVLSQFPKLDRLYVKGLKVTDRMLESIGQVGHLRSLTLRGVHQVTESGYCALRDLRRVTSLHLADAIITTKAAAAISRLGTLEYLSLSNTSVTDEGIASICHLERLKGLMILECPLVTDRSLGYIGRMSELQALDVVDTRIGIRGMRALKAVLPRCEMACNGIPVRAATFD